MFQTFDPKWGLRRFLSVLLNDLDERKQVVENENTGRFCSTANGLASWRLFSEWASTTVINFENVHELARIGL